MAAKTPDLGAVHVGATRGEVEMQLGTAVRSSTGEDGARVDVYQYEIGNGPSAGRVVAHAVMDVSTFALWEVAGTPIEGFQGQKYQATAALDDSDRVTEIKTRKAGGS